jgi:hypothetical protein
LVAISMHGIVVRTYGFISGRCSILARTVEHSRPTWGIKVHVNSSVALHEPPWMFSHSHVWLQSVVVARSSTALYVHRHIVLHLEHSASIMH